MADGCGGQAPHSPQGSMTLPPGGKYLPHAIKAFQSSADDANGGGEYPV